MTTFQRFENIEAWQSARELTKEIYKVTKQIKFTKDYGLKDQITRVSVSVMSNISEGFERGGAGEFLQFLSIAKGSIGEIKSQLYVALDQEYVSKADFDKLYDDATKIGRMIGGLIQYLKKSDLKGIKYKNN